MAARGAAGVLLFPLTGIITSDKTVAKRKAGGYIFINYTSDHPPLHVHIFDVKNKFVGRWDIENQRPMDEFDLTKQLRKALHELSYLRGEP